MQNLWLCCTESLALSPRLPLGFPTVTGENTGEHVCLPNVESNTQPLLWEALLAVTGGSAPGLADFRSLERCENAKGREDWQNYWLWYFIIHISKEETCTDNRTLLIKCYQRFPEQYRYQRWQYQQSPQQKVLYLSKVIRSIVASLSAWFFCSSIWVVLYLFLLQNFSTSRYLQMYFSPHWSFCGIYTFPDCWNPKGSKQHFNFFFFPTTGSGNRDFT